MVITRRVRIVGIWALLAVLLSYSYDFECLLESQACLQQQAQQVEAEVDSICSQPTLMPAVIALLPTCAGVLVPPPPPTELPAPRPVLAVEALAQPPLAVPLGLRAPPLV